MKWLLSILFLIPSTLSAQGLAKGEQLTDLGNFSECGLVTRWASNKIPSQCLTKAKNVYFDEDMSVSRRYGYGQYSVTPCADQKQIRGLWNFDATDGQQYIVIFSSTSLFWTKSHGDCNPISGLGNLNYRNELECVQALGKINCTNGIDFPFSWDGISTSTLSTTHFPKHIGTFRNRLVFGGLNGEPSRIRLSGEGDGSDWDIQIPGQSTTPASVSISGLNDGKSVRGFLGQYQNAFFIGREDDLYSLAGNDRRDFTLRQVSAQIGIKDAKSVKEKDNCLIWLSNRGIEKMCGTTINRASDGIKPDIDSIIKASGNTRTKNYDTEQEWEAGLFSTSIVNQGRTSTTIYPGSVVPSTWGYIIDTGSQWSSGTLVNIDTYSVDGNIILDSISRGYSIPANFPIWTCVNVSSGVFTCSDISIINSSFTATVNQKQGIIRLYTPINIFTQVKDLTYNAYGHIFTDTQGSIDIDLWINADSDNPNNGNFLRLDLYSPNSTTGIGTAKLINRVSGSDNELASNSITVFSPFSPARAFNCQNIHINSSTSGLITATDSSCGLSISAATPNPSINTTNHVIVLNNQNSNVASFRVGGAVSNQIYYSTGIFTSPIFDTNITTTVGGPYYFDGTNQIYGSTISYRIRESELNNIDSMGPWVIVSTNISGEFRIPLTKRYWQTQVELNTQYSTQTPIVDFISLQATNTGYYIGDCINAVDMTSWGNFSPLEALSGGSKITYYVNSGDSCNQVTRSTAPWQLQNANSPISASTANFLGFMVFEEPVTTTDTLRLDALTIDWNEGSERPPVSSIVYNDRYYMFYTTNTQAGAHNDSAIVLDLNDKWSKLSNIEAYSSIVYNNQLYTGDSNATGLIYVHCDAVHPCSSDVSGPFDFSIKTADFDYGNPLEKKELKRIYLTLKSEETSGQNIKLNVKYYINGSTTPYSLTVSTDAEVNLNEAVEPGYFVAKLPAINTQPTTFNWLAIGIDYAGNEGPLRLYSIKVVYKDIRME